MEKKIFVEEITYTEYMDPEAEGEMFISEVQLHEYDLDEFREIIKTHDGSFDETGFYKGYHRAQYWFNGDLVVCKVFERIIGA